MANTVYTMYRGDDRTLSATITATYDAGATIHFAVKTKDNINPVDATDSDALFTVNADSSDATDNGDGTVTYTVAITDSLTAGKTPGKYVAEIEYIDGSGNHTTFSQFDFILLGDINQRS